MVLAVAPRRVERRLRADYEDLAYFTKVGKKTGRDRFIGLSFIHLFHFYSLSLSPHLSPSLSPLVSLSLASYSLTLNSHSPYYLSLSPFLPPSASLALSCSLDL